jgi:hypothetical protein
MTYNGVLIQLLASPLDFPHKIFVDVYAAMDYLKSLQFEDEIDYRIQEAVDNERLDCAIANQMSLNEKVAWLDKNENIEQ